MSYRLFSISLRHSQPVQRRLLQTSPILASQTTSKENQNVSHQHTLDQGNIHDRQKDGLDPQAEAEIKGMESRASSNPLDAASSQTGSKSTTLDAEGGNPEKIGFIDQVGGQTASAQQFEGVTGQQWKGPSKEEGAATSGFVSTVKSALGLGHAKENIQESRKDNRK